MNSSEPRQFFWAILFISLCSVTPRILTSDNSCPCRPSNECPDDSQLLYKSTRVSILPCESEHLIRCCSVIPRSIESVHAGEFSQSVEQTEEFVTRNEINEYTTEGLAQFMETEASDAKYGNFNENLDEYSTIEYSLSEESVSHVTTRPQTTEIPTDVSTMNRNVVELKNDNFSITTEDVMTSTDVKQRLLDQQVLLQRQEQRYLNSRQFVESRPTLIGTSNKDSTSNSSTIRFPRPEVRVRQPKAKEEIPEVWSNTQEQDLIDRAVGFESIKVSKVPYPMEQVEEATERNIVGKNKFFFPERTILNRNYRSNANFKFLSIPKSVSEKTSNYLKQKTSLETSFTLDRVSTRASNENAKPRNKLDRLPDDATFTSIRNLP